MKRSGTGSASSLRRWPRTSRAGASPRGHDSSPATGSSGGPHPAPAFAALGFGLLLLLVSNGRWIVPAAAWLAPFFLLRAIRRLRSPWAVAGVLLLFTVAARVMLYGIIPSLLGFLTYVLTFYYALLWFLPYLIDRILVRRIGAPRFAATLVFPAACVVVEYANAVVFGDWGSIAFSLHGNPPLGQILSVTGMWGVTFLIAWFGSVLNWTVDAGLSWPSVSRGIATAAGVYAAVLLYGGVRLAVLAPHSPTVRVASFTYTEKDLLAMAGFPKPPAVQGPAEGVKPPSGASVSPAPPSSTAPHSGDVNNAAARAASPPAARQAHPAPTASDASAGSAPSGASSQVPAVRPEDRDALSRVYFKMLFDKVKECAASGAALVFWAEGMVSVREDLVPEFVREGGRTASDAGIYLLMPIYVETRGYPKTPGINKAILLSPAGDVLWDYIKSHPVPGSTDVAGNKVIPFTDTPFGRVGAAICYDFDFPAMIRQAGRGRVDIMLDPSWDWRAIDPLHTRMAAFRAVENGFALVRQTGEGLSAAFDGRGERIASMDHFTSADRTMIVDVPTQGDRTLYARVGDVFAWLCLSLLLVMAGASVSRISPGRQAHRRP